MNKDKTLLVLKQISFLIGKLSEEDLKGLLDGSIKLGLVRSKKSDSKKVADKAIVENYVSQLRSMTNREEGRELLNNENINRVLLKALAKQIDIPITHKDNLEVLKEKIIEATIGYRLRSQAIQNNVESQFPSKKDLIK